MRLRDSIQKKTNEKQLKGYLHSFLKWLYVQNHHFIETLTNEEIANYFIQELNHEDWFQSYLSLNQLKAVSDIYEFIAEYKSEAIMLEYTIPIHPKRIGAYHEIKVGERDVS